MALAESFITVGQRRGPLAVVLVTCCVVPSLRIAVFRAVILRWRAVRGVAGVVGVMVVAGGMGFGGVGPVSGVVQEFAVLSGVEGVLVAEEGYSDIAGAGVHRRNVETLLERGVLEGTECGPEEFCPAGPIQRWVMAVWLVRAVDDAEPDPAGSSRFSDVDAGEWWLPYVERLADLGITLGCAVEPARFCPADPVTRQQMASFLVRAFQLEPAPANGFIDVLKGNSHLADISALAASGITAGCATEPARFCPDSLTTRAQMATFLARALGIAAVQQTITPATVELSALGETVLLIGELRDQSGKVVAGAKFSWESSDDAVATVNATGLVTAVGNGTATITATAGSASTMATVAVAQRIAAVAVEPAALSPAKAGTQGADTIVATALDSGGSPVVNASYRWSTDRHSGWVYPPLGTTDALGRFQATWVAGWPGEGTLSVTVENQFSRVSEELTTLSTTHGKPPAAHAYMWIKNRTASAGYSIDMTPLTDPAGTYYAAIQWDGGYTGLQSGGTPFGRQLQFSVWNAPGYGDAELIDNASDVLCTPFGGEGTGINCEMHYPWNVGSTYRFEVTEEEMNGGSAITLHVTDLASGHRRFVGTIRFARRANFTFFGMFVEDFTVKAPHCLARQVRSAAIRRPRAWIDGEWVALPEMSQGSLGIRPDDPWNPGTPSCANFAVRQHEAGLEIAIGGKTASDPNGPRSFTIPLN